MPTATATYVLSFAYTYDAVGDRLSETRNDGRRVEYEYNEVNQLTKASVTNDPNGNDTTTTTTMIWQVTLSLRR